MSERSSDMVFATKLAQRCRSIYLPFAALRSEALRDCLPKVDELVILFNESYMLTTGLATKTPVGQRRLKTPQARQ